MFSFPPIRFKPIDDDKRVAFVKPKFVRVRTLIGVQCRRVNCIWFSKDLLKRYKRQGRTLLHSLNIGLREEASFAILNCGTVPPIAPRLGWMSNDDCICIEVYKLVLECSVTEPHMTSKTHAPRSSARCPA